MAKKENPETQTYVVDEVGTSRFSKWKGSRSARITAISIGSALAMGVAFTGGVVAAKTVLPHQDGPGFAEQFDRYGDHGAPDVGPRSPKPGHDDRDDRDGDRDSQGGDQFQIDPNTTSTPNPATTTP